MHEDRIDLFTADEVKRAKKTMSSTNLPHSRLVEEIITEETLARINRETGQANDRDYLAYRLEFIANQN